jgi:short-subunit dehydrogenase
MDASGGRARALITGASGGIGAAFASALAQRGMDLVVVARDRERLAELAQRLRDRHAVAVEILPADLTDRAQRRAVELRAAAPSLEVLVNAAGLAAVGRYAELAPEAAEQQIALNFIAVVRLTRAALPGMIARRRGTIINVSSIAAFVPARFAATYAATKASLNSFSESLHEELRNTGVQIQVLCPGFTRTAFVERAGADGSVIPAFAWMTPEAVVAASLAALPRGRVVCVPGLCNRVLTTLLTALPRRWARRLTGAGAKRGWAAGAIRRGDRTAP